MAPIDRKFGISSGIKTHSWVGFGFSSPRVDTLHICVHNPEYDLTVSRLPLWIPFLLIALPTAWLWHRDRRRIRPGCCLRCGYDLTGNTSGVCPECGEKARPPAASAVSEGGRQTLAAAEKSGR